MATFFIVVVYWEEFAVFGIAPTDAMPSFVIDDGRGQQGELIAVAVACVFAIFVNPCPHAVAVRIWNREGRKIIFSHSLYPDKPVVAAMEIQPKMRRMIHRSKRDVVSDRGCHIAIPANEQPIFIRPHFRHNCRFAVGNRLHKFAAADAFAVFADVKCHRMGFHWRQVAINYGNFKKQSSKIFQKPEVINDMVSVDI